MSQAVLSPSVLILTVQRSGSSWVSQNLMLDGRMGIGREWFTGMLYPDHPHPARFPLPTEARKQRSAFVDRLRSYCCTPNGVASAKILSYTIAPVAAILAEWGIGHSDSAAWITDLFPSPVVIVLRRRDRLGQAISWWRARATHQYTFPAGAEPSEWPDYDFCSMRAAYMEIEDHYRKLDTTEQQLRDTQGIRIVDVTYEQLVAQPETLLHEIASLLALPSREPAHLLAPPTTRLRIQRDKTTETVRRRFVEELNHHPQ